METNDVSLFPTWRGEISLPSLPERKLKISGNWITQAVFPGSTTNCKISDSQIKGHLLITTGLGGPYREVLFRPKGTRRVETTFPVVTSSDDMDPENLPEEFSVKWDSLGELDTYADSPSKVLGEWANKFDFRTEDEVAGTAGLRTPQIGALHAISAHFSVGEKFEPATVVLPTGTGKTETMLATLVYRRLPKLLVLVPSTTLRAQIAGKFKTLGILPDANVVPIEIPPPYVATISTGLKSVNDAKSIVENANVIVALPNALEASDPQAVEIITGSCTDLIVDEAHHITAKTWLSVREKFDQKRILQFTATPFRRDGKRIDGKIIFNYRLGDAQAAGYYKPINLHPVEEYGPENLRDDAIAREAISALTRDRAELGYDHLLMARTKSKARAEEVLSIYERLAPELNPIIVYSGPGRANANKIALNKLHDEGANGARIVVCVDMLGEGFDLPNLKIAALHDTHKSLAVTLQFIGRFTRTGSPGKIGEATVVTNIADPEAEAKLADLYAEGADWDQLIQRLSEERVDEELRLQDIVYGLKEAGTLHTHLSLWNLRPALSTQIFRTDCADWHPLNYASVLPKGAESWHAFSEDENVLVAVTSREERVSWGNYQDILNSIYDLLILKWDKTAGALFIYASDYNGLRSEKMADAVTKDKATLVSGTPIFHILNNVELPLVKSLGSSRVGAISFTSYFGPNVTEGLASVEKAESSLNNIACLGYEDGERVLWGGTQRRGKVWQQKKGSISEWLNWAALTWDKVASEDELESNITRDFLRPEKIDEPHGSYPISVQWGEQAQMRYKDKQYVFFDEIEVALFEVDLSLGKVGEDGPIDIIVESETSASAYRFTIDKALSGGYRYEHVSGPIIKFRRGNQESELLEEYLEKDPLIIRYADGTFSYNCYHIPTDLNAGLFDKAKLEAWDWADIPLNRESMHKSGDTNTIQYRTFIELEANYDIIFNDDGCGEAADLVCLRDIDESTIELCLVHCKGAHDARVSQDIRNFYTVCGQAQKSITAKHAGVGTLYHDLKRRHETWAREGKSRFLKGDMRNLSYFKEKSRRAKLEFEMVLVQPGASIATVTDDALRLLATTELYLSKTTQAKFRVIISD